LGHQKLSKAAQAPTLSDRIREELFQSRSRSPQSSGKNTLDSDLRIQDWGGTCQELELQFDRFEYLLGVCGNAGNLNRTIEQGGNPFESPR
jgi:gluconate 2-dehydrogenase alpha chain